MDQHFGTLQLPDAPDVIAPDGSRVRVLLRLGGGSMARFELAAGQVSRAVAHHAVDELWYVLSGRGGRDHAALAGRSRGVRGPRSVAGRRPGMTIEPDDSPGNARVPLAGRRAVAENSLRCERWWACNQGTGRYGGR